MKRIELLFQTGQSYLRSIQLDYMKLCHCAVYHAQLSHYGHYLRNLTTLNRTPT